MTKDAVSASEDQSFTFRDIAKAALADVDALDLEGSDRAIVLRSALDYRVSRSPVRGDQSELPARREVRDSTQQGQHDDSSPLSKVAAKLSISRELVDVVYDWSDGELTILISPKLIATGMAQAARELAQIVAAGRQAAGMEEWTAVGVIRDVVHEYGRFDSGNFATSIQALDHNVCVFKGQRQQRQIKITRPGFDAVGELLRRMNESTS